MNNMSSAQTVGEAVKQTAQTLQSVGIEPARLEARMLVGYAIGGGPERVLADRDRNLSFGEIKVLSQAVDRRTTQEPMAHILGTREFWSLNFKVTSDTLVPRPDSETLIEAVLERFTDSQAPLRILDLGTGSGCLLLALLSEFPFANGFGIDVSDGALSVARENATTLGFATRVKFATGDWRVPGWSEKLDGPYDLVISNPPYISDGAMGQLEDDVVKFEPHNALSGGADGLDAYRLIFSELPGLLKAGGVCAFEIGFDQGESVATFFEDAGFDLIGINTDLGGRDRAVLASNVKPQANK